MCAFNSEATIGESIGSFVSQNYKNKELIIVDGASSDSTLEIARSFKDHNIHISSEPDGGIYDGLNRGFQKSSGALVGVLHTDDIFAHEHVLQRISEACSNSSLSGAYGDLQYVSKADTGKIVRYWKSKPFTMDLLSHGWMPPHPTLFVRRAVMETFGTYDTTYKISADYDAILRWFKNPDLEFSYIPELLSSMRVGGESNKSLRHILRKMKEDYRAIKSNNIGGIGVLARKNLSKVHQFFHRQNG